VRALLDIALSDNGTPVSLRAISERQNLPISYLEQIFNRLKRVGMVQSVRGVNGGYHLGRIPDEITVGSIIKTMEGPIRLSKCDEPPSKRPACIGLDDCVARIMWKTLEGKIDVLLEGISIGQLVKDSKEMEKRKAVNKYEESIS